MNKTISKLKIMIVGAMVALASCSDDENTPAPVASFEFEISESNTLQVDFENTSRDGKNYVWDFGDDSDVSTEQNPSHTYSETGTYTVTLTVINDGGTDDTSQEVTVVGEPPQLIVNGGFDDDSAWTLISHNSSGNGLLTIADGVATYDEAIDVPSGAWGSEAHMGMYQAVEVTGGNYQLDLDITVNGFDEVWFEVWVGQNQPVEGSDYNSPAIKVLTANAWDCKDTQGNYSGSLAANFCDPNGAEGGLMNGKIALAAGTYYVVIRSGGFTFGEGGIVVDNVSMKKVN